MCKLKQKKYAFNSAHLINKTLWYTDTDTRNSNQLKYLRKHGNHNIMISQKNVLIKVICGMLVFQAIYFNEECLLLKWKA